LLSLFDHELLGHVVTNVVAFLWPLSDLETALPLSLRTFAWRDKKLMSSWNGLLESISWQSGAEQEAVSPSSCVAIVGTASCNIRSATTTMIEMLEGPRAIAE
jgi:hypothetical protein